MEVFWYNCNSKEKYEYQALHKLIRTETEIWVEEILFLWQSLETTFPFLNQNREHFNNCKGIVACNIRHKQCSFKNVPKLPTILGKE